MTIGEAWASYQAAIIPANAPAVQREECKRAFYGGAASMLSAVFEATSHDDEDVCQAWLSALDRELEDFITLFKKREGVE